MSEVLLHEPLQQDEELLLVDERESEEVRVELLYRKVAGEVLVHLVDFREDNDLTFPVPSDKALDAFRHPYPYYGSFVAGQKAA